MSMLKQPILTIITVVWNDHARLLETARSIQNQPTSVEWLVIDGASTDNTLEATKSVPEATIVSEPDNGLYDAMNKGIRKAKGKYLVFINAGDRLNQDISESLSVMERSDASLIVFAYEMEFQTGRKVIRNPRSATYIWHSLPTSHQAIVYKTDQVQAFQYDPKYKVSADYQLTCQFMLTHSSFDLSNCILSSVSKNDESFSQNHFWTSVKDCWSIQRDILNVDGVRRLISLTRRILAQVAIRLL